MKIIDWGISRLSKCQDEMLKVFKKLTEENVEVVMEGSYPIVRHNEFSFMVIDNNVIMKNTITGESTTAFFGIRSTIKDGILKIMKSKKEKK